MIDAVSHKCSVFKHESLITSQSKSWILAGDRKKFIALLEFYKSDIVTWSYRLIKIFLSLKISGTYKTSIKSTDTDITVTAGHSWQEFDRENFWEFGNGLEQMNDNFIYTTDIQADSSLNTSRIASFFARTILHNKVFLSQESMEVFWSTEVLEVFKYKERFMQEGKQDNSY